MFKCLKRRGIGQQLLESLHGKVDKVLTDLTALNTAVDAILAAEAAAANEMAALRDEVSNLQAGTITQEQIDAITQRVTDAATALQGATEAPDGGIGGTGGETPPAEGETPPAEGETPPAEGETPPAEGEQPPAEGETPPGEGEQQPA